MQNKISRVDGRVEGLSVDADVLGGGAANPDNNINNAIYGLKGGGPVG
jgi:hypothetical protein